MKEFTLAYEAAKEHFGVALVEQPARVDSLKNQPDTLDFSTLDPIK